MDILLVVMFRLFESGKAHFANAGEPFFIEIREGLAYDESTMSEKLVLLRTVPDKITAELEKGFLQENGMKAMIKPDPQASGVFMGVFGGFSPMSPWTIYVKETDAQAAKELLGEEQGEAKEERAPATERSKRGVWYMISLIAMILALLIILL